MKKVLLVDDDPVFASIAAKSSKEYGIEIDCVSSFKKLKKSQLSGYDAFLIDYDLGDGTGEEVLEFLSQQKIERPVAMISATSHVEDTLSPIPSDSYEFISKWQDSDSFFRSLYRII